MEPARSLLSPFSPLPPDPPPFFLHPPHPFHFSPSSSPSSPFSHPLSSHTHFSRQSPPTLTGHTHLTPPTLTGHTSVTPPTLTGHTHLPHPLHPLRFSPLHQTPPTNPLSHAPSNEFNHRLLFPQPQPRSFFRAAAPSLVGQSSSSGIGDTMSMLPRRLEPQEGVAPGLCSQSSDDTRDGVRSRVGKRRYCSFISPPEEQNLPGPYSPCSVNQNRSLFKVPRLEDRRNSLTPVIRGSFQNPHDPMSHSGADGTQDGGISSNAAVQSSSSLVSSPPSTTGDVARVSLNLRLPRYPGGATPTSGVATSNQTTLLSGATEGEPQNESAIFDNDETGNMCTYALFEPTASSFAGLPQSMPTITSSSATTAPTCDQTVPSTSSPVQTRGRGFSLSVEISGSSDRVDSIDLNLDVSGIPVSHLTSHTRDL